MGDCNLIFLFLGDALSSRWPLFPVVSTLPTKAWEGFSGFTSQFHKGVLVISDIMSDLSLSSVVWLPSSEVRKKECFIPFHVLLAVKFLSYIITELLFSTLITGLSCDNRVTSSPAEEEACGTKGVSTAHFSFEKRNWVTKSCRNLFFFSKRERMKDTSFVLV